LLDDSHPSIFQKKLAKRHVVNHVCLRSIHNLKKKAASMHHFHYHADAIAKNERAKQPIQIKLLRQHDGGSKATIALLGW